MFLIQTMAFSIHRLEYFDEKEHKKFERFKVKELVKNKVNEADAIAVSSKDITGFDKLSKEILNFID